MNRTLKVISIIWLVISLGVAALGVFQSHNGNPESGVAPALLITFLTLPFGLLVQLAYVGVSKILLQSDASMSMAVDALLYLAMIGVGYWQWFILLPKLVKKIRNAHSPKIWWLVLMGILVVSYGLYRFYLHVFPSFSLP